QRLVSQLDTGVIGFAVENGHFLATLDFGMPIIAVADAQARQLEARQGIAQLAAQVPAVLLHADVGHRAAMAMFFFLVPMVVVVPVITAVPVIPVRVAANVLVRQQSVAVFLAAVRQAQVAPLSNETAAQAVAISVVVGTHLLVAA